MTMNETLNIVVFMLAPAFFSLLGMGAFGSTIVALLGELAAKSKQRVFYDKYGQQVALMGAILLTLTLIVQGASIAFIFIKFPNILSLFNNADSTVYIAVCAFAALIVFSYVYFTTWKSLKNHKVIHGLLGFCATLSVIVTISAIVPAKLLLSSPQKEIQEHLAADIQSMILPMTAMYTIFAIVAAAGMSCLFLVLRRKKDDFGRDYYNFVLKLAARWAAIPMVAFLACQGWLFMILPEGFKAMVIGTPLALVWCANIALSILCLILWVIIARSKSPLQLKGLTLLGALLLWFLHTMNATLFANFMSMF